MTRLANWARSLLNVPQRQADRPILLVEHHGPLARALLRAFEEEGIVAHRAGDDVEGDALARSIPYAAVVIDWKVPRAGAAALVRGWRRDGLTVPVLLLLPAGTVATLLEGLDAGADDFLPLPFSLDELLARLRAWIDRPTAPVVGRGRTAGQSARPLSAAHLGGVD